MNYVDDPDTGPDYLYELREARKSDGDVLVRWFTNNYFDLALWLDPRDGHILGFQLCYDKLNDPHALTWKEAAGYYHNRVDDGENPGRFKMSPLLVPDGIFNKDRIVKKFKAESVNVEPVIRGFVLKTIEQCAL